MLSLGGWLLQKHVCDISIVSIFNTAWSCMDKDLQIEDINEINHRENEMVFDLMDYTYTYWDYPEAMARRYTQWSDAIDFEKDHELIAVISLKLTELILGEKYAEVYFPMAIEKHVDHDLIFRIMHNLLCKQKLFTVSKFYIYEDLPYAYYVNIKDWIEDVRKIYSIQPYLFDITAQFARKKELLLLYKSQITPQDILAASSYAQRILPNRYTERVWEIINIHNNNDL